MAEPSGGGGIELRHLRYVLALAELRSFRRAAAFLALSPRALSREIARVERALGTRLFERLPGRAAATPAGRQVAGIARHALAGRAAQGRDAAPGGGLRVGWPDYARRFAERARIARELHDSLLQDVVGSGLELEALRRRLPPSVHRESAELERVIRRLERVARDAREVMGSLGPARPGPRDLAVALSLVAEALREGSRTGFRMETRGAARGLHARVEAAAYRVGAEAISNAFRHAGAACVAVSLDYSDDLLRLSVSDDGAGMEPGPPRAGGGLARMGERAEGAGGTLTLRSGPGAGTTVEMVVPGHAAYAAPGA